MGEKMRILTMILFLLIWTSPVIATDFVLNADGSVADLSSGLVWHANSAKMLSGREAVDYCDHLETEGSYFWRLPVRPELAALDSSLQETALSAYWVSSDSFIEQGVYCFGDGAYFPSPIISPAALVRCVSENPLASAIEAVNAWAASWQNGDIEAYLSSYDSEFQPGSHILHSVWEQQRRDRLSSSGDISIQLQTEEINSLPDQIVEFVFVQDYHSSRYHDRVRKRLHLRQQQGRWLIAKEEQLTSLPRQALSATATY